MKPATNLQYFEYSYSGTTYYFATCINGEGYYNRDNNTILGALFSLDGKRISTSRIDYSLIKPLQHSQVVRLINDIELQKFVKQ